MASVIEIYNRALSSVAARSTVASLTEQSAEAKQCNTFYASVRDQALRAANWNFARKMATLSLLKSAPGTIENPDASPLDVWSNAYPQPPWLYEYSYPSDAARVQFVQPQTNLQGAVTVPLFPVNLGNAYSGVVNQDASRFMIGTDQDANNNSLTVIFTNVRQALCVYTQRMEQTSVWDSDFTEVVVCGLAGRLAGSLTGDKKMMQMQYQLADNKIKQARTNDANEGLTIQDHVPDWIAVRGINWAWGQANPWMAPYGPLFSQ